MVKTITIKDSAYKKLLKIKGNKSFSEAIERLVENSSHFQKNLLLKYFGIMKNREVEEGAKRIRKVRKVEILP